MKLSVAVVFAALFVVSYGADVMFFQDLSLTRMANLGTGEVKILGTSKQPARPVTINAGTEVEGTGIDAMSNFALQGGNLYAYSAYDFQIWKYTQTSGALAVSVFSGATTGAAAGGTDGAANAAAYGAVAGPLLARADGSLWFFDNSNAVVRKIAPDGGATTPLGVIATAAASTDGVGTSANFLFVNQAVQTKDGTVYFTEAAATAANVKGVAGVIRKIAPDLAVTTIAGSNTVAPGNAVYTKVEGAGTNAVLSHLSNIALSKDEQSLYFVSSQIAAATTAPALAATGGTAGTANLLSYTIRKLDISAGSSFLTSVVLEQNQFVAADAVDQVCKDGVGTSAVLCPINVMVADGDGNLIVNQIGRTSEVFKKVNVTAGSITTLAGNPVVAALQINPGLPATALTTTIASVSDGTGTNAVIIRPRSALIVQSVCGKLSALGSNVTITSDCEELSDGGSVPKLIIGGSTAVTKALTVQDSLAINSNGKLTANAPITVGSGIVLTGNGTLVINDQTVTANSLTLATETVYHVLVQNLSPKVLSVVNNAGLAGTIVVCIAKDFNFNVGANAQVLNFGSKTGAFAKVFLVKLRTAVARRSLLQAAGATVGCGATSCIATGTNFAGDDDDEVGIIVALAIVGTLLALVLFGACFLIMKKTSDKNVEQIVAGQTAANFSYSSSSSSEVFGPQDAFAGYDYDYSY